MSDGQAPASPETPAAPVAPAPSAPASTPAPAQPTPSQEPGGTSESVLDTELPEDKNLFDRDYVSKLREEAAKHRVSAKEWKELQEEFKDHFEGPGDLKQFLDTFRDPQKFLGWYAQMAQEIPREQLREIMSGLLDEKSEQQSEQQTGDEDLDRPMTRREYQELQEQQRAVVRMAREDREIDRALAKLNLGDDDDKELVIRLAQGEKSRNPRISHTEALTRAKAKFDKRLEAATSSVAAKDEANRAKTPGPIRGAAPVPGDEERPKDFAESRARAKKRLGLTKQGDQI